MIASFFRDTGFDTTDLLIVLIGAAYLMNAFVESKGWSRSSKRLREENQDLLRRNDELVATVARHETALAANDVRIRELQAQVQSLEKLDQSAVLSALHNHEIGAKERQKESTELLSRIAAAIENTTKE